MDDVSHSSPPAERPSHSAGSDCAQSCQFFSPSGETQDKINHMNSALLRVDSEENWSHCLWYRRWETALCCSITPAVFFIHKESSDGFVLYTLLDKSPWWIQETWCELPCRHTSVSVVAWHLQHTDSTQACNYCGKGVHVPSSVCKYDCPFTHSN